MAYDAIRDEVVMFGGRGDERDWDDTWIWDGSDWTEREVERAPFRRYGAATAFDENRGVIVVHGGMSTWRVFDDTWAWDGERWRELHCPADVSTPGPRHHHAATYDPATRTTMMFGGSTPTRFRTSDQWRLKWLSGPASDGACCGDGVCDPSESCGTCSEDCGACCGDGVCDPTEDCGTCAADCGCDGDLGCVAGECRCRPSETVCGDSCCDPSSEICFGNACVGLGPG
jgi:hypothetical protein